MRSGGDVSSPASTAEGHSLGSLDLQAVADGGILPGSSLTSDDTKPVLPEPSPALSTKTEPGVAANTSNVNLSKQDDSPMIDYSRSIWAPVIQHLVSQLRHDAWEARHGSSLALRDLIRLHGESYGMKDNLSESQNQWLRDAFLGSLAAVLLEMLAVDRFGDFVGDQVVAPVREAGSQALASLMRHLDLKSIAAVHSILQHMVLQEWISSKVAEGKGLAISKHIWELRHAGLLGLKYELAVRPDLISGEVPGMDGDESHAYMEGVLRSSLLGLADADDDVRAVSAACLLPIAGVITERLSHEALMKLLDVLWNTFLEETDELNSSIASVMELLSKFAK
ncbi:hypothetical protein QFC19_004794 [Naganishia cerealis]|uniref:Uncharacterized protein n=1 Tax=Naganishia cerealis TaxID=610337 RepID=A0ACC2VS36_9TREE|nr:hypothetical protein QFC19_004794 [Naganishia cerealis]